MSVETPKGWASCKIGEITQIVSGGTPPSKDLTNFTTEGGIPWITPADLSGYKNVYISHGARNLSDKGFSVCSATKIPVGSVLFSSRAPVGYVAIAANELSTNQGFKSFVLPDGLDSRFIYFYLKHIKPIAEAMATGTTFKELSGSVIAQLPLTIAPFNEQRRIADKLDSLLARVDACRDRLHKIPITLKCFRQSILVAATSGQFFEENWLQTEDKTATILLLSQVVKQLKTGPFGSVLHRSDYVHSGVPLVNPMHINAGRITPSNDITISREKAEELREYQLKKGDIVIARRGVMGRCAVVGIREQGWLCGSGSMIIRTTEQILPEYLQLVLSSPNIVRDLESNAVGSTMVNLNQQIILNLKIPVPSIVKQELIINHVRVLFLLADRIEEYHQNAIKQVEQLTPTLLSKAFCGELVPQDPNDEPAAILLDRIHAERIANPSILKRDLITRKPKMTNESVKKIIDELPSDAFSFEDLHKQLAGDYDSFKDILFELLDEDEPSIEQMFDKQAKAIHFIRKQK